MSSPAAKAPSSASLAPPALLVIAAFASLYFFWGSTYLAIRWAIEQPHGFPPFFMAGVRNLLAGVILYTLVRSRARFDPATRPKPIHWRYAAFVGTLLLLGGNGLVTFASQFIPSSLAALLIAALPIWMALLERLWEPNAPRRRSLAATLGIALGFGGVTMLIGPKVLHAFSARAVDPAAATAAADASTAIWPAIGAVAVVASSFSWANGSLLSRRASRAGNLPASPFLSTAMQLICGGLALLIVSGLTGEFARVHGASFLALKPVLSLLYLVTAGSLIGFTSYIWLLGVTTPSRVATYAYVNPVVAVWLGWWLGNEALDVRTLVAAAVIIAGVVLIVTFNRPPRPTPTIADALDEEEELCGAAQR